MSAILPNATDFNLEKDCWDIIDSYFSTISNYISKNQIDSYNMFLDEQIGKTIRQFNPLQLVYESDRAKRYEVDIIIGGTRVGKEVVNDGMGVYVGKATVRENIKNPDGTVSRTTKQLYPNEARLKNLSYSVAVYCDIYFTYKIIEKSQAGEETLVFTSEPIVFERKLLGKIPCMLQSKGCVLSAIPRANLKEFGECPYDHGGYFIIDGKEKVITAQTRQIENKIYTRKNKRDDPVEYEAEIRSTPEDKLQPARITRLYLNRPVKKIVKMKKKEKRVPNVENIKSGIFMVAIPNVSKPIPIFVLFRALGITSDHEILQYICGDTKNALAQEWAEYLYDNIILAQEVRTQIDALRYIQNLIRSPEGPLKKHNLLEETDLTEDQRNTYLNRVGERELVDFKYIYDILYNWVFPHMGTSNLIEKGAFLGYMAQELLKTKWGMVAETSRDSYMYKRIDVSGFLVATIFRDLYFRVKNKLTNSLNSHFDELISTKGFDLTTDNFNFFVNNDNLGTFFLSEIMTDGFRYAFKNCWGLRDAPCKEGVVQDLARLTYLGMISHLRRVVTPLSASSKLRDPHMLHLSTYGILCPIETPDGANVGVKTNIALLTDITFGTHSGGIYQALLDNRLITLEERTIEEIVADKDLVRVILNGRLVGYHKYPNLLVSRLRLLRRNALINVYTSVAWYIQLNEIKISTDSGRSCHPMLIVDQPTRQLKINRGHIEAIRAGRMNWYHLIAGRDDWNQYDHRYYRTDKTNAELNESGGVVEFIDTEEANTLMLAMEARELVVNPNTRFTHCEIHPSIIFGIMGSIIPFVGTNQLPRNLYSCGQGKQAIGVYASNYRNRMDTKTQVLYYSQKPLVQNRISKHLYNNILPYGQNATIAIACYTGYNQDDSIIFNKSAVNRGLFRTIKYRTYSVREDLNEYTKQRSRICNPILIGAPGSGIVVQNLKPGNYSKLGANGIIKEGVKADENDIVCGKVIITNQRDENGNQIYLDDSTYVRRAETGTIDRVFYSHDNNDFLFVKIRLRKEKIPELGDKFASRAGQKGIMGMLLNEYDMPFTKRGVRPDMIINPQAFPKRMTISQFVETVESKECSLLGFFGDSSPFQTIPLEKIGSVLEGLGYERYGTEVLYNGMTGEQIEHDIFIGPTYYERLQHQVEDKMHARAEGSVTMLSKQPTGGRSIGGGLRIGEMERDAILAHGTSAFLKETMADRSDATDVVVCSGCGTFAMANPGKHIYHCYNCNSSKVYYKNNQMNKEQIETSRNDFQYLQMPYAMKLLTQELEAMSVGMHMITQESAQEWKSIGKYSNTETRETDLEALINLQQFGETYYVKRGSTLDLPFRKYQNIIKNLLISGASCYAKQTTALDRPQLIDLSAGQGGDLMKWIDADYSYVLALDLDPDGLYKGDNCLTARYAKLRENTDYSEWFSKGSKVETGVSNSCLEIYTGESFSDTGDQNKVALKKILAKRGENSFDVVSAQFSAHYCFDTITNVHGLLKNISKSLKTGGCAVITTMNGEKVYDTLKRYDGSIDFRVDNETLYSIRFAEDYPADELSSGLDGLNIKIKVMLATTGREITEYLVSPQLFISQAKLFGLRLMTPAEVQTHFNKLDFPHTDFLEPASRFEKSRVLDDFLIDKRYKELAEFSDLFCYYIFIKDEPVPIAFKSLDECRKADLPNVYEISLPELRYYMDMYGEKALATTREKPRALAQANLDKALSLRISNPRIMPDAFIKSVNTLLDEVGSLIYVRIKNGQVVHYSPVVDTAPTRTFENETIEAVYASILEKFKLDQSLQMDTIAPTKDWRVVGCTIKTTLRELRWSDLYYTEVYHMLVSLCKARPNVPDVELLINPNDIDIASGGITFNYPVLQFTGSNLNREIVIPNPIDWHLATGKSFKSQETGCISTNMPPQMAWTAKKNVAIFRGTAKGCVKGDKFNPMNLPNYRNILNDKTHEYMSNRPTIPIDFKYTTNEEHMNLAELGDYKYIFCVDGYTPPLKTAYLMLTGSLVIRITRIIKHIATNTNKLWYDYFLNHYIFGNDKNKVPVENADCILIDNTQDIPALMDWIAKNPAICQRIAENGQQSMRKYINQNAIFDYLYHALFEINQLAPPRNEGALPMNKLYQSVAPKKSSIDISLELARIVQKNRDIIMNYFDLNDLRVHSTIVHARAGDEEGSYRSVSISGIAGADRARQFIEDLAGWQVSTVGSIKSSLLETIMTNRKKIEVHFDTYLFAEGNQVKVFGKDPAPCSEYLLECTSMEEFIEMPWMIRRKIHLVNIEKTDLVSFSYRGSLAIVVPVIYRDDNSVLMKGALLQLCQTLNSRSLNYQVYIVEQSQYTTLKALPAEIIEEQSDQGIRLKHNLLGLIAGANRLIPKSYRKVIIMDYSWQTDKSSQVERLIDLLVSNKPIIQSGSNFVVNDRYVLDRLPNYLFGSTVASIKRVIAGIPRDEKTYELDYKPTFEIADSSLEKDYGLVGIADMSSFRLLEDQRLDLGSVPFKYEYNVLDFLEGALPLVLAMDKLPVPDNGRRETVLAWSYDYLTKYIGAERLKKTPRNIQVLDPADIPFASRLLVAMRQVILKYYAIVCDYTILETGHIQITYPEEPEPIEVSSILPYYTIGHSYYIRNITMEMLEEVSQKIRDLKQRLPAKYPHVQTYPNHVFILKLGDWVVYYDTKLDTLVFYSTHQRVFQSEVPSELAEIDFDLVLIMFKDKNESLLKVVMGKSRLIQAHPHLPKHKVSIAYKQAEYGVDKKVVQNLLRLQPAVPDLEDKVQGYVD